MAKSKPISKLGSELQKIVEARHHDPFSVLGCHPAGRKTLIRAFLPHAEEVSLCEGNRPMQRVEGTGFFEWLGPSDEISCDYRLIWKDDQHREHIHHDPYTFPPQLSDFDLHLFGEGRHHQSYRFLGSRVHEVRGTAGVLFAVWAPSAERVSVVGDFNRWDGRCHPMRVREGGIWELFIPDMAPGTCYKYEIRNRHDDSMHLKTDPYGRAHELSPATASIVQPHDEYSWHDDRWMQARAEHDWQHSPMSIYEVHLGSWRRGPEGELLNYRELARQLVDYLKEMGFSHLELMPITEHPYDLSWGYQATGYFAPTSRFGSPDDFRYLVDLCHMNGIGVILDWVPAHFPKDAHGLARFDGTPLYEHADPRKGEHLDWSTLIYNYGRHEVKCFLISSAVFWLKECHIDALRVDAVASMLYLDYSRDEWTPNEFGGNENLEAIAFMRQLNEAVHAEAPGVLMMAEESTSWPQVTKPTYLGGLGFDLKWNMGWMNDTLSYFSHDPVHRSYSHDMLTFSMLYAFSENFLLPFSHDEVVHGKQSMLHKMPGDEWQRFANLRLLYTYMYTHPGKKLLFMGTEFGQGNEWNSQQPADWWVLDYPLHQGIQTLVKDMNHLYHGEPALFSREFEWDSFEWIDCNDSRQSVLSYLRKGGNRLLVVLLNFTPVPRENYRIGVPEQGKWQETFNSDSSFYGGSNMGNGPLKLEAEKKEWMNRPYSLTINLPPLAGIILQPAADPALE